MLNDNNFDEIGKRLYDFESDPPADGWKKIKEELEKPSDSLVGGYIKKHGWKALTLLLPVFFYFMWPDNPQESQLKNMEVPKEVLSETIPNSEADAVKTAIIGESKKNQDLIIEKSSSSITVTSYSTIQNSRNEEDEIRKSIINTNIRAPHENNNKLSVEGIAMESARENDHASFIVKTEKEDEDAALKKALTESFSAEWKTDSVKLDSIPVEPILPEAFAGGEEDEPIIKKDRKKLKVFLAFTPQFIYKSIKPLADDEVLISSINNQNKNYPERIGYNLSAGVGFEVLANLFLEGRISYDQLRDNLSYTYSTGALDTLLKHYRADGIVEVTPVYSYQTRELATNASMGGVKIGATFYFLANRKRSLNISASAGMNFLLASKVSEQMNGQWVELTGNNFQDITYNLSIGAGYTRQLGRGLELMVTPRFIYNLSQNSSGTQPFVIRQHAYGLEFMLSKKL